MRSELFSMSSPLLMVFHKRFTLLEEIFFISFSINDTLQKVNSEAAVATVTDGYIWSAKFV